MTVDHSHGSLLGSDALGNSEESHPVRIVGSGLSRTGTRSVYAYLLRNGLPALHYPFDSSTQRALEQGEVQSLWSHMSILDLPSALSFETIADQNPRTLVVHTTRDFNNWVPAVQKHYLNLLSAWKTFPTRFTEFSEWISCRVYGDFPPTADGIARAGRHQEERIEDWIRQNPEQLIIVNVFTGEGFDQLHKRLTSLATENISIPHITDADEVPLSSGLAERTLLREEPRPIT